MKISLQTDIALDAAIATGPQHFRAIVMVT